MYGKWELSLCELIQWLCRVRSTVFGLKNKGQHQGARQDGSTGETLREYAWVDGVPLAFFTGGNT